MKSVKDSVASDFAKFGIKSSKKEKCDKCNYGMRITVEKVDGTITSNCKYCNDNKKSVEWGLPQSKEESKMMRTRARANAFSRIPKDIEDVKLNEYVAETEEQKRAKQEAVDFVLNFEKGRSLSLSGAAGVGKSHIAVAIANALKKDYSVLFLKSNDILTLIKESYDNAKHSEKDVLDACKDVDLLIIDDIGAEYSKNNNDGETWASNILFNVLDSRLGKSVIVTTNYSESQLKNKFAMDGERIVSRMHDNAKLIRVVGKDGRRK